MSLRSQNKPWREIPESEGTDQFAISGDRIYFPSNEAPKDKIRVMSTPITGYLLDRATDDDFEYDGTRSDFAWNFKVYGDTIYFGDNAGNVFKMFCRGS